MERKEEEKKRLAVTEKLKQWIPQEIMPQEIDASAIDYIEKFMQEVVQAKKLKEKSKRGSSLKLDYQIDASEEAKKSMGLIEFLIQKRHELVDVLSAFDEKTFRQSREIIDNKLNTEKSSKASLLEKDTGPLFPQKSPIEPIIQRLDLSPAEDRLIHTISLLLSRNSERSDQNSSKYYMGNYESGLISVHSIEVETARMLITPHELYSTYLGRDDYNTHHIQFILDVLNNICKKNYQITLNMLSKTSTEKKKKFDKVRTFLPLFQIAILNHDLTESESQEIDKNELLIEGKKCRLLFKFGPLFTNNIRDRYVEFPEDIHLRIANSKSAGEKGRIPQCVNLMRDLLFRERQQKRYFLERDEETLVHILGLSKEWEAGKKGRVLERLNKSFDVFQEIGLVKKVVCTTGSKKQKKYQIEINPDFK
jgi:hypothetical protein